MGRGQDGRHLLGTADVPPAHQDSAPGLGTDDTGGFPALRQLRPPSAPSVRQCPSVSVSVRQCPSVSDVRQCPSVSVCVRQCPLVSDVRQCPSVSVSVRQLSVSFRQCPPVSASVRQCPSVSASVRLVPARTRPGRRPVGAGPTSRHRWRRLRPRPAIETRPYYLATSRRYKNGAPGIRAAPSVRAAAGSRARQKFAPKTPRTKAADPFTGRRCARRSSAAEPGTHRRGGAGHSRAGHARLPVPGDRRSVRRHQRPARDDGGLAPFSDSRRKMAPTG